MYLERLSILNFKNIEQCELPLSRKINCFVGDNGTGKTNLLDALYFLSMSKSALNLSDGQCVRHESDFFMLSGDYVMMPDRRESVVCSFKRGSGKTLKRNGKEYERVSEHIGLLPIVLVSPSDTALINESGDERRRFMNLFLSQTDRSYLTVMQRYNQLLAERNKLLKSSAGFEEVIDIIDIQLCEAGSVIHKKRADFATRLAPVVSEYYRLISGDAEQVEISYKSELSRQPMQELLRASGERDRILGHTTCGVHRDDLVMSILGYPIRKYGSQGQQKSMLIALKLAQFDIIKELCGVKPIMLLDDVFDKLDLKRVEHLIELVAGDSFGQILITDSNKIRMEGILDNLTADYLLFEVAAGMIQPYK